MSDPAGKVPRMDIHIEPWSEADLGLLHRLNAPEMTAHLGGPEPEERVVARHRRYLASVGMFRVVADGAAAGSVGFWEKSWRGGAVYEVGWAVLPEFQGRGVASAAASAAVAGAKEVGAHRSVRAFPSVEHAASNAVCRKLGFTLYGEVDFDYPPGHVMRCNDWGAEL